jgi:hypothetical protein
MQAQSLDLRPERGLERGQGRGLVRAQGPRQKRALVRRDGQRLVRGLVSGLERGPGQRQGQCLVPTLVSGPERRQDKGLLRGQGLPQLSGVRCAEAIQNAECKLAEMSDRKRLGTNEERCTMNERTSHVTFGGCGFSNTREGCCVLKSNSHKNTRGQRADARASARAGDGRTMMRARR